MMILDSGLLFGPPDYKSE